MRTSAVTIIAADASHFDAITRIERGIPGSIVALTAGHALAEAIGRGHEIAVALEGTKVVGWVWFAAEDGRGGETIGQIFRIAARPGDAGAALLAHARERLAAVGCARIRATIAADDGASSALLVAAGFTHDAITLELPL